MTDKDGNTYKKVKIGEQEWMAENLNVSKYSNGDPIPQVQDDDEWSELTTGAWCYYENETENGKTYGKLYNWYAVNDPRGLAPEGWHIPSYDEWSTLENSLAYMRNADAVGGKLKEAGFTHWKMPNVGATNERGFSALPGGYRDLDYSFKDLGNLCCFWSATVWLSHWAEHFELNYEFAWAYQDRTHSQGNGLSVRCLKD